MIPKLNYRSFRKYRYSFLLISIVIVNMLYFYKNDSYINGKWIKSNDNESFTTNRYELYGRLDTAVADMMDNLAKDQHSSTCNCETDQCRLQRRPSRIASLDPKGQGHASDIEPSGYEDQLKKRQSGMSTSYHPDLVHVVGKQRPKPNYLSIGIPSIRRENGYGYLINTTQSLISTSTSKQQSQMTVFIFLADFNITHNNLVADQIQLQFSEYLNNGFLQILRVNQSYYPELEDLKKNYKDSSERVQWRAKQVVDYALLFNYATNQSRYYLQLEDDVICSPGYFESIQNMIIFYSYGKKKTTWTVLEFSELGFIGKLFKNSDLIELSEFMLMFYDEQPIDWLINYFRLIKTQKKVILSKPTLFQHMGETSSFDTQSKNTLKDRYFMKEIREHAGSNPAARLTSTMQIFAGHKPDDAYISAIGEYFWAQNPLKGDTIQIAFTEPQTIHQILIETGNKEKPADILELGRIDVSNQLVEVKTSRPKKLSCKNSTTIGYVRNGKTSIQNVTSLYNDVIGCILITVESEQSTWIVFDYIGIFT